MDDDLDLLETSGDGDTAPAEVDVEKLQAALAKANKEALDARLELRRTQLEKDYGEEIVGLIPEALPQKEWKDYAEKLKAFRGQPSSEAPVDQAPADQPQAGVTPEEQALAAAGQGPGGAADAPVTITREDFDRMMKNPAERGMALIAAKEGRVSWNNPEAAAAATSGFTLQ